MKSKGVKKKQLTQRLRSHDKTWDSYDKHSKKIGSNSVTMKGIKLDSNVEKLLKEMEEYSKNRSGIWSIPRVKGEYLYRLILKETPSNVLELGTSIGYSTIWLGLAAREISAHVLSVDNDPKKIEAATQNIAQAGLSETVTVRLADAANIMKELKTEKKSFEFIFMDTNKKEVAEKVPTWTLSSC